MSRAERVEPCPFCGKGTAVEHDSLDNCFIVRCLHCGYTSGHIASERGAMIRHNKICRALPKPDPDWKATCAKCCDGDIEPDCEYYGEPNGCNSPIYGEHPKSAPVGNAAAMREAALPWIAFAEWLLENAGKDALGAAIRDNGPIIRQRLEELRAALAAPPRNCDRTFIDHPAMYYEFRDWCNAKGHTMEPKLAYDAFDWLLATANEKGATDGK